MAEGPIPVVDLWAIAPVSLVMLTGIVVLIVEMFRPKHNNNVIVGLSLLGLTGAIAAACMQFGMPAGKSFGDMVYRDHFGLVLQILIVGACFVAFLFSEPYLREKRIAFGEFYPLALWACSGAMIMVTTTNMLMLFLGLEVLSIALYCLAGMSRAEARSEESALKYFLLGAFASAFLLMGIAFLYGPSGTLDLSAATAAAAADLESYNALAAFGVSMLLIGLAFKAGLVPFHQWTPDVYQGAPTNVTALMAAVVKVAAFGALVRVLDATSVFQQYWFPMLYWIAILSMTLGNLIALIQRDVKRTLGYSSIANAGYILVALLAHLKMPDRIPLTTTIFFLGAYSLMTLGAFAVVSLTAKNGSEGTRFADLRGLWHRAPFATGCFIVFSASLIGVPPTVGFFGKLLIFQDALTAGLPTLAILLAVNSAISAYYYLGMIQAAFVSPEGALPARSARPSAGTNLATLVCVVGIFAITIAQTPVLKAIETPALKYARPVPKEELRIFTAPGQ
ncbi:MAG: NADH-quinone oxidoreductase subunit N [Fimbriimonadaceae bacterium]|nr:NADH-quinone oxidoreductase subunit N [Fimbriimonadaceae bacterium]QYK56850.1 MAG: NADH-quinone oxidoreductase subunit N [Fimbriimonadaceae bacterium]